MGNKGGFGTRPYSAIKRKKSRIRFRINK